MLHVPRLIMKKQFCVLLLVPVLMLMYFASSTDGLSCVQCHNCGANYTEVTECPKDQSELCLKILHKSTKTAKATYITDKRCSNSTSSEILCTDLQGITSCLFYCRTDGCNTAHLAVPISRKLVYGAVISLISVVGLINVV